MAIQLDHAPGISRKHPRLNRSLRLRYRVGDATNPVDRPTIICHVNNDIGAWGRGFVVSLSKRFPQAKDKYLQLFNFKKEDYPYRAPLGHAQIFKVEDGVYIANMIAQHGIRWQGKTPPIRYEPLKNALTKVYAFALENNLTVSMPRIGVELAGGDWKKIEQIIFEVMTMDTVVYTLESQRNKWETSYENP